MPEMETLDCRSLPESAAQADGLPLGLITLLPDALVPVPAVPVPVPVTPDELDVAAIGGTQKPLVGVQIVLGLTDPGGPWQMGRFCASAGAY